jgi:hypothetical protein
VYTSSRAQPHSAHQFEAPLPASPGPSAIRLDPLPSGWWWIRQWKLENRDGLSLAPAVADHDEPASRGDVDLLRDDWRSHYGGLERKREVLLDGRVKSDGLLGFGVRVDDSFLDQCIETCCRDPGVE